MSSYVYHRIFLTAGLSYNWATHSVWFYLLYLAVHLLHRHAVLSIS